MPLVIQKNRTTRSPLRVVCAIVIATLSVIVLYQDQKSVAATPATPSLITLTVGHVTASTTELLCSSSCEGLFVILNPPSSGGWTDRQEGCNQSSLCAYPGFWPGYKDPTQKLPACTIASCGVTSESLSYPSGYGAWRHVAQVFSVVNQEFGQPYGWRHMDTTYTPVSQRLDFGAPVVNTWMTFEHPSSGVFRVTANVAPGTAPLLVDINATNETSRSVPVPSFLNRQTKHCSGLTTCTISGLESQEFYRVTASTESGWSATFEGFPAHDSSPTVHTLLGVGVLASSDLIGDVWVSGVPEGTKVQGVYGNSQFTCRADLSKSCQLVSEVRNPKPKNGRITLTLLINGKYISAFVPYPRVTFPSSMKSRTTNQFSVSEVPSGAEITLAIDNQMVSQVRLAKFGSKAVQIPVQTKGFHRVDVYVGAVRVASRLFGF